MVTWFHQVKQLFLIPILGVLAQNLGPLWGHGQPIGLLQFVFYSSGFVILVIHYIKNMKIILCGHGQLFGVWQFVYFSLGFVILVLHYFNNMKTILAVNANACLKNQMNNMERKIHSTVNVLYPCNPAYSKLANVRLPKRIP